MSVAFKKCLQYPACVCRHEDGTVRFWDASGVCLYPKYKLSTAGVFYTDADPNDNMNSSSEGEWPPFRKVCMYVCYTRCNYSKYSSQKVKSGFSLSV